MSKAKQLYVKEGVTDLKKLLVNRSITLSNRIRMLILIKNKSHVKKDLHAVADLKKTSDKSAANFVKKTKDNTKK